MLAVGRAPIPAPTWLHQPRRLRPSVEPALVDVGLDIAGNAEPGGPREPAPAVARGVDEHAASGAASAGESRAQVGGEVAFVEARVELVEASGEDRLAADGQQRVGQEISSVGV